MVLRKYIMSNLISRIVFTISLLLLFCMVLITPNLYAYSVINNNDGRNVYTFSNNESITLKGKIKIECYGGKGGNGSGYYPVLGGNGGKAEGELVLTQNEPLYVNVGYGGGLGSAYSGSSGGNGGGASDIRRVSNDLINRIIVAGGGGGGGSSFEYQGGSGGNGGGLTGGNGSYGTYSSAAPGSGGTQTSGGTNGQGGNAGFLGGGGGGGWYGGSGAGAGNSYSGSGGGGGSSYIGGVQNGVTTAGVSTTAKVIITLLNYYPEITLSSPVAGQIPVLSDDPSNNQLIISGTVIDGNIGDNILVKYTIDGVIEHTNVTIGNVTSNNMNQPFLHTVIVNNTIPEGTHNLRIWAEDDFGGKSEDKIYTIVVEKVIGDLSFRTVSSENKAFNVDSLFGSYTDKTESFMNENYGNDRPIFLRIINNKFNGTNNRFYDFGSTMTYIGNNCFRVVTSDGKSYDVNKDTGNFLEITDSFMINNFGQSKPFYHRIYEQEINGYGPFSFHDFGSTMAYIGNNKIRVVTSERKTFDVDKDTGAYVELPNFLDNKWGSGKPFYLREYTHSIGGEAKTFYDWGTSMTYIGNNTLRVVTSEGKAFDVDANSGAYTDITSTFLVNNFGPGKPFYHREYPVTINGTIYTFHDWGTTMAYTDTQSPEISIYTPLKTAAFNQIILTGKASDKDNRDLTISSSINGVSKTATLTNTQTPQDWTLIWDIAIDNIPDVDYSNIAVQADTGVGDTSTVTYFGTISVFGPNSNVTKKTIIYEYDENGKLIRRLLVTL